MSAANPVSRKAANSARNVAIVGAGVAGLAAAEALTRDGANVILLERRAHVGGRAYSYLHPALGEVVDSQHVLVGCCSNLIDLTNRAGLADRIRWYDRQTWLEPANTARGPQATIIQIGSLPAPLHYAASFLRAPMLSLADKLAIARGLMEFRCGAQGHDGAAALDQESVGQWYARTGQTGRAIHHLWEPLVLATLNDSSDNCSMKYAGKVFYELFLSNRSGGRLGIPTVPLSDFYSAVAARIAAQGGRIEMRAGVDSLAQQADGRWMLRSADRDFLADDVILALPFEQTQRLLSSMSLAGSAGEEPRSELLATMTRFAHSPYISVLLWFDREITDLDHAWLLDSPLHWFFHKSRIRGYPAGSGSYVEVVISGSRADLPKSREELLATALSELARFFPEAARARVVKSGVLKEARATFTLPPGEDAARLAQTTAIPGLYLAGDWTATGWPSTMEGACRSGRLAAGAVTGNPARFLSPDRPPTGLSRWLAKSAG